MGVWKTIRGIAVAGCFLACPVIVGRQVLGWLETGHWQRFALADWVVGNQPPPNDLWQWIYDPHSWYGLHVIVKFLAFDLPAWVRVALVFYMVQLWMGDKEKEFSGSATAKSLIESELARRVSASRTRLRRRLSASNRWLR